MTLKFSEGQDFTDHYSLLHNIGTTALDGSAASELCETWLAVNTLSNERVAVNIYVAVDQAAALARKTEALTSRLSLTRGLIHPNIVRTLEVGEEKGHLFVTTPFNKGASPVDVSLSLPELQPQIDQLLEALSFVHGFGITHGELNPASILVSPDNQILITNFTRTPHNQDLSNSVYLSPQLRDGQVADISADIYALGALLYKIIANQDWHADGTFAIDKPITTDLKHYLEAMLSPAAQDRPTDLATLRRLINENNGQGSSESLENITPSLFSKATSDDSFQQSRPDAMTADSAEQGGATGTQFIPVAEHATPRERSVMSASSAFMIFALIAVLGGLVFFYLPTLVPTPTTADTRAQTLPTAEAVTPAAPENSVDGDALDAETSNDIPLAPMEAALLERLIVDGKAIATELLRKQLQLEDLAVGSWARQAYSATVELGLAGDEFYRLENYQAAMDNYQQAMRQLDQLLARVEEIQALNLERGETALLAGDEAAAREAYKILNAIDPGNPDVEFALMRAENLGTVLVMMKSGEEFEQNRSLEKALTKYQAAFDLDPDWAPAASAVDRIEASIVQNQFNEAMSRAFTALSDGDYEAARKAFIEAGEIIPESTEPADGLLQIEIAKKQTQFAEMRQTADALVEQEKWGQALQSYKDALDQDSTLVFAKKGYQLSLKRNNLDLALERYINSPAIMVKDSELTKAKKLLVQAAREKDRGAKLKQQIKDLSLYVSLARIPVELQIRSDSKTDITVYRVATLGKIYQTSMELIPGAYTIVGTRKGYRDVHENLTLLGGRGAVSVDVSCTEKI